MAVMAPPDRALHVFRLSQGMISGGFITRIKNIYSLN